jgi:hypothetical protein
VSEKRSFGPKFLFLIKQITQGGSMGVKVNEVEGDFFLIGKGLDKEIPWYLFCLTLELMFFS